MTRLSPLEYFEKAGLLRHVVTVDDHGSHLTGVLSLNCIEELRSNKNFACGVLHGLHPEVGTDRIDFRSYNNYIAWGSLQLVIDQKTGAFYADVDAHNPYNDVARFLGHAFGEVIPHWWRSFKEKFTRKDKS